MAGSELLNFSEKFMLYCYDSEFSYLSFPVCLYSGVFLGLMTAPVIADFFGRRVVYCISMFINIVGLAGLVQSSDFTTSLIMMLVVGLSWPGKVIVGTTYSLEFLPERVHFKYLAGLMLLGSFYTCFITTYFQHITKDFDPILCAALILSLVNFMFAILFVPESPYFFYQKGKFQRCRQTLEGILKMNG